METNINDGNFMIAKVKLEPEEFATSILKPQATYGCFQVDHRGGEDIAIKKESCVEGSVAVRLDTVDVSQNILKTEIGLNDVKITMDLRDGNNLLKEDPNEISKSCNKSFSKSFDFMKHIKMQKNEGMRCDVYTEDCAVKKSTLQHMIVYGNNRYKCKVCSKCSKTRKIILKHVNVHIQDKIGEEAIAMKTVKQNDFKKSKRNVLRYTKTNDGYKCVICSKCFARKDNLSHHMKIHTGERNHKCEFCLKRFVRKDNLLYHTKIHSGERNYECEICTKRFRRKGHLSYHTKMHAGERNYKCDVCAKRFIRKEDLSLHATVHDREINYKCEICSECFAGKDQLSTHKRTHADERNFKCDVCTKRFKRKYHLSIHTKVHTGERNYPCAICGRCFTAKGNLTRHVKTHANNASYNCEICSKRLTSKRSLAGHMKVHAGKKTYACEICAKCYTRKDNLSKHVETHAEVNYKCEFCAECFTTKRNCSNHLKGHSDEGKYDFGKRKALLKRKKIHADESGADDFVRKLQFVTEGDEIEKRFIKEDVYAFIKQEKLETGCDTTVFVTNTNINVCSASTEVKAEPTEILHRSQKIKLE